MLVLTDLQEKLEAFVLASDQNVIADVERISTVPMTTGPLGIFDPPLIGVADAQDPLWERLKSPDVVGPCHLSPDEWLPGARTVVSYFLPFTKQVRLANRVRDVTATEWIYGRWEGQAFNLALSRFLVGAIESTGGRAMAPELDRRSREVDLRSNWSHRHAAFIAGLGTFSLSRSMITRLGSAGRFGSVVTDVCAEPTVRAYEDVYEYCANCGICIGRCPCQAISATGKDHGVCKVHVDKTRVLYAPRYGCGKCQTAVPCESRIPRKKRSV
jgi:epoxyqueuosine reductase QueG